MIMMMMTMFTEDGDVAWMDDDDDLGDDDDG